MTNAIIISICILLLLAYVFDFTAAKTKIPSVILLLLLGWGLHQITLFTGFYTPNLEAILPIFGTIGLILIVLEGSLELNLDQSKFNLIGKSSVLAFIPIVLISFLLAYAFMYFGHTSLKTGMVNAIPFSIISSAIAIPSAKHLISSNKEFVTYESSLSDIFGVIFFNFILYNESFGIEVFSEFFLQLLLIIFISFIATIGLTFLLQKIKHHVKFTPIVLLTILIYAVSKEFHLPALLFILLFGLFLGNFGKLNQVEITKTLHFDVLSKEVHRLKELVTEITFLIRSMFFLLFGFLLETTEILNIATLYWAIAITASIFIIRAIMLKIIKIKLSPLLYIAPRGLITILLFLSIPQTSSISIANKSLIIQVIILTALVMMFGLVKHKPHKIS